MKRCPHCQERRPQSDFHRSLRSADGLQRLCKDCTENARRERVARKRAAAAEALATAVEKRCVRCGIEKPWDAFYRNSASSDGHQSYCKVCAEEAIRRSREKHAEAQALRWAEKLATPTPANGVKECRKCGATKPLLSFYAHRGTKDGRANYCNECQRAASRQWTRDNVERVRARNVQRTDKPREHRQWWLKLYGLTQADYEALLNAQGGVCAICLQPERFVDSRTGRPRRLSVDHDHATGHVRGLLCGRCNRTLGHMNDNPENFDRAAEYLRRAVTA